MKYPENDIGLIERYLEHRLTESEADEFRIRLREDSEFQKLYNREQLLINTIRWNAARQDLDFLKQLEQYSSEKTPGFLNQYRYYFAAAACITLIAIIVLWPSMNETPENLFASYFTPYPNVFEPTLRGNETSTRRTEAFQAYDDGDYRRASTLFTEMLKKNKEPGILMLLGNSNLWLERTNEAINNFTELRDNYDELDDEARWFLGLCHLKNGDLAQARLSFREISGSESPYALRARKILEEMER